MTKNLIYVTEGLMYVKHWPFKIAVRNVKSVPTN